MMRLPEPAKENPGTKALFLDYLDYYRATIESKLEGLSEPELRTGRLPSGWAPLALLKHLIFMERRWLRWGFSGEPMSEPFGEADAQGHWYVDPGESAAELIAALHEGGRRTRLIAEAAELSAPSAVGGRFASAEEAPPLVWVLFHVLQEYARHAGHLDIVRELSDGDTGE